MPAERASDLWGPYLSERAWGTVREDYSAGGTAWADFPHDQARWRAYRWSEDGLAGLCDVEQRLCLALALWNGRDPILKERAFGLVNEEGNHGEDVKEYWWYLDATPDHSWLRWRYHYPQQAFPYEDLVRTNRSRSGTEPEYELLDTGVFDGGYWVVEVTYAKAADDDVVMRVEVRNAGPERAPLHVLPTLWFRNTWSWDAPAPPKPQLALRDGRVTADHPTLGRYRFEALSGEPEWLFCENETNAARFGGAPVPFPKDTVHDHVVGGGRTPVNPAQRGTKAAAWYRLELDPGASATLDLRLSAGDAGAVDVEALLADRRAAADAFFDARTPADADADEARILRQAVAGLVWSKQYYGYDVERWLEGDAPAQPAPPATHAWIRNTGWRHLRAADVIAMPDPWEYPWFAAWDLAFHAVAWAHVDPAFAKRQLALLTRETYQHPAGFLPAYEWSFDDANPPVHGWAALKVWAIDGGRDRDFLERIFLKLRTNFTAWLNRKDVNGDNVFTGGFLGLDNISVVDRSHLPPGVELDQSDATAWMAFYSLTMAVMADRLGREDAAYRALVPEYLEHFALIAEAFEHTGLWDEEDAFYYDHLRLPDGRVVPLKVRSVAGLVPLLANGRVDAAAAADAVAIGGAFARLGTGRAGRRLDTPDGTVIMVVDPQELPRMLADVLDEQSFLSPYGLRSLSARRRGESYSVQVPGTGPIAYEPAEASFAHVNSNWRGPIWFPLNHLLIDALARMGSELGDLVPAVEYPTGSDRRITLEEVSADLRARLISIWRRAGGRRPVYGAVPALQDEPEWRDNLLFFEYFHGDDGAGLGAMHQTGWTALVADLITGRRLSPDPLGALSAG